MPEDKITVTRNASGDYMLPMDVVCRLSGVTKVTMTAWGREPDAPPKDPDTGKYPATAFGEWMRKKQTLKKGRGGRLVYGPDVQVAGPALEIPSGGGMPVAKKTYDSVRIRKEEAQAEKIEMENAVARGLLVKMQDVEDGWGDILSRVKTRLLQVPYKAALVVVGDDDLSSVRRKIKDFIDDALMELSTDWRDQGEDDENV